MSFASALARVQQISVERPQLLLEKLSSALKGMKCTVTARDFEEKLLVRFSKDEQCKYVLSYPLDMCTDLVKS